MHKIDEKRAETQVKCGERAATATVPMNNYKGSRTSLECSMHTFMVDFYRQFEHITDGW